VRPGHPSRAIPIRRRRIVPRGVTGSPQPLPENVEQQELCCRLCAPCGYVVLHAAYCMDMNVRGFVVIVSIVGLGVLTAACSRPSEPSSPPSSTTTPEKPTPPASGMSWLKVTPEQGAPGSVVSLDVACLDTLGPVHSPVLDIGALKGNPEGHQPWHLFGSGTVRSGAAPGRYQMSATCGGTELSAAFTVLPAA
jgi:hypothetical protein